MRFQRDPRRGFPPDRVGRLSERQTELLRLDTGLAHPSSCADDEV